MTKCKIARPLTYGGKQQPASVIIPLMPMHYTYIAPIKEILTSKSEL